jgi:hypothetical protein
VVGGCGFGELGRLSPVICRRYRVDFGLRYDLCSPGKHFLVLRFFFGLGFLSMSLLSLVPELSEVRCERPAAELRVGPFGRCLNHMGQPPNKSEHLHCHRRLSALGQTSQGGGP